MVCGHTLSKCNDISETSAMQDILVNNCWTVIWSHCPPYDLVKNLLSTPLYVVLFVLAGQVMPRSHQKVCNRENDLDHKWKHPNHSQPENIHILWHSRSTAIHSLTIWNARQDVSIFTRIKCVTITDSLSEI